MINDQSSSPWTDNKRLGLEYSAAHCSCLKNMQLSAVALTVCNWLILASGIIFLIGEGQSGRYATNTLPCLVKAALLVIVLFEKKVVNIYDGLLAF